MSYFTVSSVSHELFGCVSNIYFSVVYNIVELFDERALLLSRLGRHEVALAIYAHILKEPELAEE